MIKYIDIDMHIDSELIYFRIYNRGFSFKRSSVSSSDWNSYIKWIKLPFNWRFRFYKKNDFRG